MVLDRIDDRYVEARHEERWLGARRTAAAGTVHAGSDEIPYIPPGT